MKLNTKKGHQDRSEWIVVILIASKVHQIKFNSINGDKMCELNNNMTIKACVFHCLYFIWIAEPRFTCKKVWNRKWKPNLIPKWNRFDFSQWRKKYVNKSDGIKLNNNDDDDEKIWHVKAIELFIAKMLDYENETANRIWFVFLLHFFLTVVALQCFQVDLGSFGWKNAKTKHSIEWFTTYVHHARGKTHGENMKIHRFAENAKCNIHFNRMNGIRLPYHASIKIL